MKVIYVDLDRTLAEYNKGDWFKLGKFGFGKPIPPMVDRVKKWRTEGHTVKIFTARLSGVNFIEKLIMIHKIKKWCKEHIGEEFPVTNIKHYEMDVMWDDKAVQVVPNEGISSMSVVHNEVKKLMKD